MKRNAKCCASVSWNPVLRTWVIGEASAFLKANDVPRLTDMVGNCGRLVVPGWSRVPREDLDAVRAATPRLVVVQRVMKGLPPPLAK